jgi:hypothetical protein
MPKHRKGIKLVTTMAMNVKPGAHDDDPMPMRPIMVFCTETAYKLRTGGEIYFEQFIKH